MINRSTKEEFLNVLENWIKETVAKNAGGHNEQIPATIKDGFLYSMQANEKYHIDLARTLDASHETALAKYHLLMSDIYKSLKCE